MMTQEAEIIKFFHEYYKNHLKFPEKIKLTRLQYKKLLEEMAQSSKFFTFGQEIGSGIPCYKGIPIEIKED